MYEYEALVTAVHDGDTAWMRIDLGFNCWLVQSCRLDGIDAPELTEIVNGHRVATTAGEASTVALMELLGGRDLFAEARTRSYFGVPGDYLALPGREPRVVVHTRINHDPDLDKYGRVLGEVRLTPDAMETVNALMLEGGWAAPY